MNRIIEDFVPGGWQHALKSLILMLRLQYWMRRHSPLLPSLVLFRKTEGPPVYHNLILDSWWIEGLEAA